MAVLLAFLYIFQFPIFDIPIINSSHICFVILIIALFVNRKYRQTLLSILTNKKVIRIFIVLLLIMFYALLVPVFKGTYDFSIEKPFFNQLIQIFIGSFLFTYLYVKEKHIPVVIIEAFFIQSLIMGAAFLSSKINTLLNNFRGAELIDFIGQREWYQGIRGLGVAGSSFFGLAIGFGMVYILLVRYYKEIPIKSTIIRFIYLLILIAAGVSAGRISLVGLGVAALYFLFNMLKHKKRRKGPKRINIITLFTSVTVIILIFISSPLWFNSLRNNATISRFLNWAFEFYYKLQSSGQLTTSSTSKLQQMYFQVSGSTFFFGDGRYTNPDQSYYMSTDAGYMRNILFFGLIGLLFLVLYQLLLFNWRKELRFSVFAFMCLLIFHIKGETIGFSLMTQNILFLTFLFQTFTSHFNFKATSQ